MPEKIILERAVNGVIVRYPDVEGNEFVKIFEMDKGEDTEFFFDFIQSLLELPE